MTEIRFPRVVRLGLLAAMTTALTWGQDSRPTPPPRPADVPEVAWTIRLLNGEMSPEAPVLARLHVDDEDAVTRAQALMTLAGMGSESDAEAFVKHARDPDLTARRRAFDGILNLGTKHPGAIAAAVEGLRDTDGWVVERALLILSAQEPAKKGGLDPVASAVVPMLGEIRPHAGKCIFDILILRESATTAIAAGLRLGVARPIAMAAVDAAATCKDTASIERLKSIASGRDADMAVKAIRAIGVIEGIRSLHWLIDRLEKESLPKVRDEIAVTLRKSTGKLLGLDVAAWRRFAATVKPTTAARK